MTPAAQPATRLNHFVFIVFFLALALAGSGFRIDVRATNHSFTRPAWFFVQLAHIRTGDVSASIQSLDIFDHNSDRLPAEGRPRGRRAHLIILETVVEYTGCPSPLRPGC